MLSACRLWPQTDILTPTVARRKEADEDQAADLAAEAEASKQQAAGFTPPIQRKKRNFL